MTEQANGAPQITQTLARPASLRELFFAFNWLALQGFGGVLAVAQRELVDRRKWLSQEQFVEMLSVAQILPGPNIVNLALMIGDHAFGVRGAFVALAGMLLAPLVVVLSLAAVYGKFAHLPMVSGALRGMGAVAAGLVFATALKLMSTLKINPMRAPLAIAFAAATVVASAWLRWPLIWILLGLGSVAISVAWKRLAR